jgi:small-conductance mechanosensitive channel
MVTPLMAASRAARPSVSALASSGPGAPSVLGGTGTTLPPTQEISDSAQSMWQTFLDALPRVGVAVAVIVAGWAVGRALRWAIRGVLGRRRTPSFAAVMSKLASWVVLGVSVLLAIAVTFPSVKPVDLLAGLGFFSVAVGFAFQDILENTLAGVLLLFRQPFRSGDQVTVIDRSGTVTEINIRETRLTTFDGESVLIPNRDVYKNVILVHTHDRLHRLQFDVGIAYDNDAGRAAQAIVETLKTVPGVEPAPPPEALVAELAVSTVNIRAFLWANSRQHNSIVVLDASIRAVKARLDRDGVEMPANIVALQATPSFRAALHDGADITPGGNLRSRGSSQRSGRGGDRASASAAGAVPARDLGGWAPQ